LRALTTIATYRATDWVLRGSETLVRILLLRASREAKPGG